MQELYDAIIVGGGIGGSALAAVLARAGRRILLLESSTAYEDRVRGEWIAPWGVTETRRLGLYDTLLTVWPSPVVALNRAVVVAMVHGPEAGLAVVEGLSGDERLAHYLYLPATRADLLRRMGRRDEAAESYRQALLLVDNGPEREFLQGRLGDVTVSSGGRVAES